MVWSQYVYEASSGFDTNYGSDDEDTIDDTPLNIEDWEVKYSDELWYMWNTIRTLLYDAGIEHDGKFVDFVELCYMEHEPYHERVTHEFEEHFHYIWKTIRRIVDNNHLHEEMLRGVTFYPF